LHIEFPSSGERKLEKEGEKKEITIFETSFICNPVFRYLVEKFKNFDEFLQKFV